MAAAAKTVEARQKWNDLADELRRKTDTTEGVVPASQPLAAEVSVPEGSDIGRSPAAGPEHARPPLPVSELNAEPVISHPEPSVEVKGSADRSGAFDDSEGTEALTADEMLPAVEDALRIETAQAQPTTPVQERGMPDPEWEELIADIRSMKRPT